jgi:lipid A 4'-phosphatase
VWIPAAALAAATALFWTTDLDLATVRCFSTGQRAGPDGFPLGQMQPWKALYDWGVYPAFILGIGGAVVWAASFVWTRLAPWRDPGLFYALLLIVGPLIIVNVLCKPYWSRPRPHATAEFAKHGDERSFVPVLQWGCGEEDSSFPSGHAAMGFYLMAPAFVCYRRRPWLAAGFLVLGLTCGGVVGLARIVAGCHFPSDVLWSGGLIYFTALAMAAPFRFGRAGGGAETASAVGA